GRSAMICTVQPSAPETFTRTRRNPRPSSTGSAIAATRAGSPGSVMSRGSFSLAAPVAGAMFVSAWSGAILVTKKSGSRRPHSQNPSGYECVLKYGEYSDFGPFRKGGQVFRG